MDRTKAGVIAGYLKHDFGDFLGEVFAGFGGKTQCHQKERQHES
jgi:hypothetical protein